MRITVARDTPRSRDSSLIEAPDLCLARISARCSAVVVAGRPSVLPCCFARCNPTCVRSTKRSRSSSATAASVVNIILLAGEVRSSAPSCRTMTLILREARSLMVPPTSCASRPSRSSLETTRLLQQRHALYAGSTSGWSNYNLTFRTYYDNAAGSAAQVPNPPQPRCRASVCSALQHPAARQQKGRAHKQSIGPIKARRVRAFFVSTVNREQPRLSAFLTFIMKF